MGAVVLAGPLSHIRVLDLSRVMAGPWAGQMLADLGADVIKVERPKVGDDTRGWGPPFLKDKDGNNTRDAGYFLCTNRGKRSLTIDFESEQGREIVRRLAARSDILLENFKVDTLQRFGLGYDELKLLNSSLIYCSITGFGQDGPRRASVAYDFMIQAMGGLMSVTGEEDGQPGGGPQKVGVPIVDLMTGMYATIAVLAALARRDTTGQGDYIDLAMFDVQGAFLANQAMNYMLSGKPPRRYGNGHPNIMPQQVFACRDGHVVLAVGNDGQFAKLAQVLGVPEWASDERYRLNAGRVAHRDELLALVAEHFATWTRADLVAALERVGVPCGPINSVPEVFEDKQAIHRKMRLEIPHPVAGSVPQIANPIRYAQAPITHERHPPLLGEHNAEILADLGFTRKEITDLAASGVI